MECGNAGRKQKRDEFERGIPKPPSWILSRLRDVWSTEQCPWKSLSGILQRGEGLAVDGTGELCSWL